MHVHKMAGAAFTGIAIMLACISCKPVKEYQKMYINDAEMELSTRKAQKP
jgi:hypothetical protein